MLIATMAAAWGIAGRNVRRCAMGNRCANRTTTGVSGTHKYHSANGGIIWPSGSKCPPLSNPVTWSLNAVYHAGSDQMAMSVRVRTS